MGLDHVVQDSLVLYLALYLALYLEGFRRRSNGLIVYCYEALVFIVSCCSRRIKRKDFHLNGSTLISLSFLQYSVKVIGRDEEWEVYKKLNGDDDDILDSVVPANVISSSSIIVVVAGSVFG